MPSCLSTQFTTQRKYSSDRTIFLFSIILSTHSSAYFLILAFVCSSSKSISFIVTPIRPFIHISYSSSEDISRYGNQSALTSFSLALFRTVSRSGIGFAGALKIKSNPPPSFQTAYLEAHKILLSTLPYVKFSFQNLHQITISFIL